MYLTKLKITNFKNYAEAELEFSEKMNCFVGHNGSGKTNLLDAIHYLSFAKSCFNQVDSQNIKHDEAFFAIHGDYMLDGKEEQLSCIQKRGSKKQLKLNQKEYERLSQHIGLLPLVMISPYDSDLINEGSDARRKFINMVISQLDKSYLEYLMSYNKVLEQRNLLLKNQHIDADLLAVLDQQLAAPALIIYEKRRAFFEQFIPLFKKYFAWISGGKEEVDMHYQSQLSEGADLLLLLQNALPKDRILQYTTAGIHKDDIQLLIDGYSVKKTASQGQQKSYIIAMRLAQFEFARQSKGFAPILLLDDIFDKLDHQRVQQLIDLVSEDQFGQVFITDTDKRRMDKLFAKNSVSCKIFEIKAGEISSYNK